MRPVPARSPFPPGRSRSASRRPDRGGDRRRSASASPAPAACRRCWASLWGGWSHTTTRTRRGRLRQARRRLVRPRPMRSSASAARRSGRAVRCPLRRPRVPLQTAAAAASSSLGAAWSSAASSAAASSSAGGSSSSDCSMARSSPVDPGSATAGSSGASAAAGSSGASAAAGSSGASGAAGSWGAPATSSPATELLRRVLGLRVPRLVADRVPLHPRAFASDSTRDAQVAVRYACDGRGGGIWLNDFERSCCRASHAAYSRGRPRAAPWGCSASRTFSAGRGC